MTSCDSVVDATPVMLRLLSSSVSCAKKAGEIIRNILHRGDLGIVMKVKLVSS